jgi:hypothetical protein
MHLKSTSLKQKKKPSLKYRPFYLIIQVSILSASRLLILAAF